MTGKRLIVHSFFVFLLPLIVAWFGISTAGALVLVLVALAWRWAITLSGLLAPARVPDLELETIIVSHYAEKVRWCMDRLGVDYTERQVVGVLGVFFTGRTVPQLKIRTGLVRSTIGNSAEILRFLWGSKGVLLGEKATFLQPTKERLEWEKRLDRYGHDLQVWVYYHILDDRQLTQYAWGCNSPSIPAWQRYAVIALYPVLKQLMRRAFRITDAHYKNAVKHIETLLADIEARLTDDSSSIICDGRIDFVDITFASLSALWVQPPEFGGGKTNSIHIERQQLPAAMKLDIERWKQQYPNACSFVSHLYREER